MTETITSALFSTVSTTGTFAVGTFVDQDGSHAITLGSSGTVYWRSVFQKAGDTGATAATPKSLLAALQAAIGTSRWEFGITAAGIVTLKAKGTGTSSVTWSGSNLARNELGFAKDFSMGQNQTEIATYRPEHSLYMIERRSCTGWQRISQLQAISEMPTGEVTVVEDSSRRMLTKFISGFHASTETFRAVLGGMATPMFPDAQVRLAAPDKTMGVSQPWSAIDFFNCAGGSKLAYFEGNWQTIPGTYPTATYTPCYLGKTTLVDNEQPVLTSERDSRRYDWRNVVLIRAGVDES